MTAENIRLVEMKERRFFSPEPGLSRQVLAYTGKLMLVRHLWKKDGLARDIAIRAT